MAKVIPLFSGRPPVGLERAEPLDDLRCRLADQEAAIQQRANEMIRDQGFRALIPDQAYAVVGPYKPLSPNSFQGLYD